MQWPARAVMLATPVEDPARYTQALAHLTAQGVPAAFPKGLGVYEALHKDTSGLDTQHPYMVDRPDPDADLFWMGPKPTGIWLGHYGIWQALALSGDQAWLILETDAKFPDGWEAAARQAVADAPDETDLLYLGSCCCAGRQQQRLGQTDLYTVYGSAPQCNHAYLLRAAAVPTLARTLRKVWAPIDIQQTSECFAHGTRLPRSPDLVPLPDALAGSVRKLTVFVRLPRLIDQFSTELPA